MKITEGDVKFLAEMFVCAWYEASLDDDERKRVDEIVTALGYECGLSEATYFEIIEGDKIDLDED